MANGFRQKLRTQVLIIGAGVTGVGVARDLTLRGVQCLVVEQGRINAGASGANHGLLHSGARYIITDPESSKECRAEGELIKKIAPHCVDDTGGLYVAVEGDDEKYIADFPLHCAKCGISAEPVDLSDAREMEPALSDKLLAVFHTRDASINPFQLSMDHIGQVLRMGGRLLCHTKVTGFNREKNRLTLVHLQNLSTGEELDVEADLVVNAAGAWVGEVAALAGMSLEIVFSKGSLLVTSGRLTQRCIIRLRWPSDADALIPGGPVSLLGPTSIRMDSLDDIRPTEEEVDYIIEEGAPMLPLLKTTPYIRAFAGVRPLLASKGVSDDHSLHRGFALLDHALNGLENFITISGGKLSTFRLMAEKTADLACSRLGIDAPCTTRTEPLPSHEEAEWTEPGASLKKWVNQSEGSPDLILCDCEMVSTRSIDSVVETMKDQELAVNITSISDRSRVGRGPCQGLNCGGTLAGYGYNAGIWNNDQGLFELIDFHRARWKGIKPIAWGAALKTAELREALYIGQGGLELLPPRKESKIQP